MIVASFYCIIKRQILRLNLFAQQPRELTPVTPTLPVRKMRLKFLLKIAQLVSDGWNLNPVLCNSRICPCLLTRETNLRWVLVNHCFSKLETWTCGVLRKYMGLTLINIESYIEKVAPFSVFFSLH